MLQALPDAPPLQNPTVDEVISLAEAEAAKPRLEKQRVAAPQTASFGNKPAPKPRKPFSI